LDAADGEEALLLSQKTAEPPDLLIADVAMPGMSGMDLAEYLKAAYPGLRVLFISGDVDYRPVSQYFLKEETAFLAKPFTPTKLFNAIRLLFPDS
jgi:two-component system, cell cycle sensor histidine kinase and response regulator CckA